MCYIAWHEARTTQDSGLLHELSRIKEKLRLKALLKSITETFAKFASVCFIIKFSYYIYYILFSFLGAGLLLRDKLAVYQLE